MDYAKCKGFEVEREEKNIFTVDFLVEINEIKIGFIEKNFKIYLFISTL